MVDSTDAIATFKRELSEFRKSSEPTATKAIVHSFVREVQIKPPRAAIIYSMPTASGNPLGGGADSAEITFNGGVRESVSLGGLGRDRTYDQSVMSRPLYR